jgi:hypothetical protein
VLENLLASRRGKPTIIAGDLNGRHPAFGGEDEDVRGRQIIDLVEAANLVVENDRDSIPTFETANGRSWIDITLSRDARVEGWAVREEETLSDHRSISFSVDSGEMGNDQPKEMKRIMTRQIGSCSGTPPSNGKGRSSKKTRPKTRHGFRRLVTSGGMRNSDGSGQEFGRRGARCREKETRSAERSSEKSSKRRGQPTRWRSRRRRSRRSGGPVSGKSGGSVGSCVQTDHQQEEGSSNAVDDDPG